jgi:hypothetical protein
VNSKSFFSEEKDQETFMPALAAISRPWPANRGSGWGTKVFCFFSSEKKILN